ncbi:MAG TPA: oxygenase MpaB family protein [Noviherbaspirillum sp.]
MPDNINDMTSPRSPIALPSLLQRRLESATKVFIRSDLGLDADFTSPPGEPALAAPDSVSWQIFKNPLTLFVGGVASVILELAEPRVRAGVWEHTSFRQKPLQRLQRTGLAAMMTVYGPRSRAEAMIARVRRMHARVNGVTPGGTPYRADDPELLNWVHATASFGFIEAYSAYAHPLGYTERDRYYAEGATSSRLYGAVGAPVSQEELNALFEAMRDVLEASPVIFEFIDIMQTIRILPRPLRRIQAWLVKAGIGLLPAWIRQRLELGIEWDLHPWQLQLVRRGGMIADRIPLRATPAVQSCRRLGLPDDYLYTRR